MSTHNSKSRGVWILLSCYVVLLLLSHGVRFLYPTVFPPKAGQQMVAVSEDVQIAYYDLQAQNTGAPTILLLHGSPLGVEMFDTLLPLLQKTCRVIVPDFVGYGASTRDVPSFSIKAQARYMLALMDHLGLKNVQIVGYSLGGGVGIYMADMAPDRITSLTLLSSIGVQELELLGDYYLNRGIHGVQLAFIWALHELTPHFGWLDDVILNTPYARSFYDTNQGPLRGILKRYQNPMLIVHGEGDFQVPPAAAREHYRIVPQSELQWIDGGHDLMWTHVSDLAQVLSVFAHRVASGDVLGRTNALPERVVASQESFDGRALPPAEGVYFWVLLVMIILATLVSEDLACIGAGLLAARGILGFWPATLAALVGIVVGDMLLYLVGRAVGRPALRYAPFRWILSEDQLERSTKWFQVKGPSIILASRFLPGSRLPTYFTAGVLGAGFWMFSAYFLIAAILWTPILVGLAELVGHQLLVYFVVYKKYALLALLGMVVGLRLFVKLVVPLFSFRGRRLLVSAWRRKTRWEFWPIPVFYVPMVIYIFYLGFKHRCLTLFSICNPGMHASGFVHESKLDILDGFSHGREQIARYQAIPNTLSQAERFEIVSAFMHEIDVVYPVVLKPDTGERGAGVVIAKSDADVHRFFEQTPQQALVQEYVPGIEFGVFYMRHPDEENGYIFSITDKQFITVTGDGVHTLEELILLDDRAVCMAALHLEKHGDRLFDVIEEGDVIDLVELGTHSRGSLFLDGWQYWTPELEAAIDELSKGFDGFYLGRYDIRVPSIEDFQAGRNLKLVELNGVTSEPTDMYDPKNSLFAAYRKLMAQWRMAFEIGGAIQKRGVQPVSSMDLLRLVLGRRG